MHEFNIFPCSLVYIISLALCGCSSCLRQQMAAVSRAALSLLVFPPSDTAATEAADEERKSSLCRKKQYNISGSASLHVIDSVLSLMWPRGEGEDITDCIRLRLPSFIHHDLQKMGVFLCDFDYMFTSIQFVPHPSLLYL